MTLLKDKIEITISHDEVKRHIVVWLLLLSVFLLCALDAGWPFWFSMATQTPYWLLYIATFYGALYWACPFWYRDRYVFLLRNVGVFLLFLIGYVFLDLTIPEYVSKGEAQPTYPLRSHFVDAAFVFTFIEIPVLGFCFQKYNILKIEANSRKAIELIRREEQLVRQELSFYKSEFNTHITFNTLSHVYAKVMDNPELASPILTLSDILRYNLKVQAHQEVPLEQELEYVKSFIEIHRVLFPKLQVELIVRGELKSVYILPRILISFVENAIKHGDKGNYDYPIKILLEVGEQIKFTVKNKKRQRRSGLAEKRASTKTGIRNVQRTLKAFYQDCFSLAFEEDQDTYEVQLTVDSLLSEGKDTIETVS